MVCSLIGLEHQTWTSVYRTGIGSDSVDFVAFVDFATLVVLVLGVVAAFVAAVAVVLASVLEFGEEGTDFVVGWSGPGVVEADRAFLEVVDFAARAGATGRMGPAEIEPNWFALLALVHSNEPGGPRFSRSGHVRSLGDYRCSLQGF